MISKYRKPPSEWFQKCFMQWIYDINITIKYFFKIFFEDMTLYDIAMERMLIRMMSTFEEYTGIFLEKEIKNISFDNEAKQKLVLWLKLEYHPKTLKDEVYNSITMFKYDLKKLKIYNKICNWIRYAEKLKVYVHESDWMYECKMNNERDDLELIDRFYQIITKIKQLI